MTYVFKICPAEIWAEAEQKGVFTGAGIDLTDGFIHFSTAEQVAETAFLHFNAIGGLVLVAVPVDAIDLVWEPSRGGTLFPHFYGTLDVAKVASVEPLAVGDDGMHVFPAAIPPYHPVVET